MEPTLKIRKKEEWKTNHVNGKARHVVKGKGWVDSEEIQTDDLVKTKDNKWRLFR